MDFGQYKSTYAAVSPSGEVLDTISTLVADEDAKSWGNKLAETYGSGFCVVGLRRSVGQPDCVIDCWGEAREVDVDIEFIRDKVA